MTFPPHNFDPATSFESPRTVVASESVVPKTHEERIHYLVIVEGEDKGRRIEIEAGGVILGREEGARLVLKGPEVSKAHCRVEIKDGLAIATDLRSTNGTFIDGVKIERPTVLPLEALLQIGRFALRHEYRSRRDAEADKELEDDLKKAADYVASLLPPPLHTGPILADWRFVPSAALGGDAFGYFPLDEERFLIFLLDVTGHGAPAAMHSVSIINLLRGRSLPGVDFGSPAAILSKLNEIFQMDGHGGLYFSMWCGVYHTSTRALKYSSGGHPPGIVTNARRCDAIELSTKNPPVGMLPRREYTEDEVVLGPGSRLYLFSDGAFEVRTTDGREWTYGEFKAALLDQTLTDLPESHRLVQAVVNATGGSQWDDDLTALALQFVG